MGKAKSNSPLVGYNTNVRHAGKLFHIQTEDSGIGRPHVITHLFTEGTILSTKKTKYDQYVEEGLDDIESKVRSVMKEQHKAMFAELRDGVHDEITSQIFGEPIGHMVEGAENKTDSPATEPIDPEVAVEAEFIETSDVRVIKPADMGAEAASDDDKKEEDAKSASARSIFETPNADGIFGGDFVSDKSLDEVILSYLQDDLDEE